MFIYLDVETHAYPEEDLIVVPPIVCVSYAIGDAAPQVVLAEDSEFLADMLINNDDIVVVGHNFAFDAAVLCEFSDKWFAAIFKKYDQLKVMCSMVRETLWQIEQGVLQDTPRKTPSRSLANLAMTYAGIDMAKGEDSFQLRYGELAGVPTARWPKEAIDYCMLDIIATRRVWLDHPCKSPDLPRQTRAAFCCQLMRAQGIHTDEWAVETLATELREARTAASAVLLRAGLLKVGKDGKLTKDSKKLQAVVKASYERAGVPVPMTDSGKNVSTDAETLSEIADMGEDLAAYSAYCKAEKKASTFLPPLRQGYAFPIHPGWNSLVASGRTSCREPNLQNQPVSGGVRACFKPRPGYVFAGGDYATAELRSLASVVGEICGKRHWALGNALNNGLDPHILLGAQLIGTTYDDLKARYKRGDDVAKDARQRAKAGNFGFPGGLGASTFAAYARGYGLNIDEARAKEIKNTWLRAWPEMNAYFQFIAALTAAERPITQLRSGRVRGGVTYTSASNSYFQGLTADGAKEAMWEIIKACYYSKRSALFGSRLVAFVHDEFLLEVPEQGAHESLLEMRALMISGMSKFVPDVRTDVDIRLSWRWDKSAKEKRDEFDRVIPCDEQPKHWRSHYAHV